MSRALDWPTGINVIREEHWEHIMSLIDGLFVVLNCPNCGYGMDVEIRSVELQETAFCPCCKVAIQLNQYQGGMCISGS